MNEDGIIDRIEDRPEPIFTLAKRLFRSLAPRPIHNKGNDDQRLNDHKT
jgi:hypothetical protein